MPFSAPSTSSALGDVTSARSDSPDSLECDWCGQSVPPGTVVSLRPRDDDQAVVLCPECEGKAD
jgi:hypothetical protein